MLRLSALDESSRAVFFLATRHSDLARLKPTETSMGAIA